MEVDITKQPLVDIEEERKINCSILVDIIIQRHQFRLVQMHLEHIP